jgi:DHA3 family macrolide efflux protein-like MFS transporter
MKDFIPVLKNKNFRYLWGSQLTSQLTINMMNFLLLTRLFAQTGSSIATSLLWIAYALPALLIGPFASATVDMVSRRKMLIWTNILQSLTILIFALLQRNSLFLFYGTVFIYSLINQFYVPAEAASLPTVITKKNLPQANSLFFLTQQGSMVLGFAAGGILIQLFGFELSLIFCAGLVFVAFVSSLFLPEIKPEVAVPENFEGAVTHFFSSIFGGYQFIKSNKRIIMPYLILFVLQITLAVLIVNVPLIAEEIFGIPLNSLGLVIVVPAGIGAAVGSLVVTKLLKKGWRKKKAIEAFMLSISLALLLLTFLLPELGPTSRIVVGFSLVVALGISAIGILIPAQTYLQESTPGGLRGRVFGNFWFITTAASVIPVIFSGTVSELLGIRTLLLLICGVTVSGLVFSKRYGQKFLENGFENVKI